MAVKLNAGEPMRDREQVALVILDQSLNSPLFSTPMASARGQPCSTRAWRVRSGKGSRPSILEEGWWGSGQDDAARLRTAIARRLRRGLPSQLDDGRRRWEWRVGLAHTRQGRVGTVEYVLVEGRNIAPTEHARAEPTPNLEEARVGFESPKMSPTPRHPGGTSCGSRRQGRGLLPCLG